MLLAQKTTLGDLGLDDLYKLTVEGEPNVQITWE